MAGATLVRAARVITAAELPLLIAIAPALLFPTPSRLMVLAAVPLIWGAARIATGRVIPETSINWALWLLLAMVGVSLFITPDVIYSLGKVSGVLLGCLMFWGVTRWITTMRRLKIAAVLFVLAGAGLAVIGLLGFNNAALGFNTPNEPGKIPLLAAITSRLPPVIRGVPGAEQGFSPNAIAGVLLIFLPLQAAMLIRARGWLFPERASGWLKASSVMVHALLFVLTLGTWLLMQSRGAAVGLVVGVTVFLLWSGWRGRVTVAAAAVAGVIAWQLVLSAALANTDWRRLIDDRVAIWSQGAAIIADAPLTGVGMNMARLMITAPRAASAASGEVAHAHNHLLQAALDLGLPGLAGYAAVWIIVLIGLARVYRRSADRGCRVVAAGLAAGLLAHFGFSMTDTIALGAKVGILFWLALALAVSLTRLADAGPQKNRLTPRPTPLN